MTIEWHDPIEFIPDAIALVGKPSVGLGGVQEPGISLDVKLRRGHLHTVCTPSNETVAEERYVHPCITNEDCYYNYSCSVDHRNVDESLPILWAVTFDGGLRFGPADYASRIPQLGMSGRITQDGLNAELVSSEWEPVPDEAPGLVFPGFSGFFAWSFQTYHMELYMSSFLERASPVRGTWRLP